MRGGLVTSVMLHAAILGWALFTIQAQRELRVAEPEPIAVDLVNASELTKLRQGVRTAKQLEAEAKETPKAEPAKKEAPKPTPVAAAPPPAAARAAAAARKSPRRRSRPRRSPPPPPPPRGRVPRCRRPTSKRSSTRCSSSRSAQAEEQKKLEEEKEEAGRAEEARKSEAKKKREAELKKKKEEEKKRKEAEAKKKFDAEKISALLNKIPDKGAPLPSSPPDEPTKHKGPVLGAPEGRDKQLSASERAMLAQIIRSCVQAKWNVSGGGEDAQNTVIKLRLQLQAGRHAVVAARRS